MKTLLLVRHAKSSWANAGQMDFERPLNERGKDEARMMAERMKMRKIKIDSFVSSPARRATKTAAIFLTQYGAEEEKLTLEPALYEVSVDSLYHVVEKLDDKDDTVVLFSHNPGITEFINTLDCAPVYDMPTCSVYAVTAIINSWKDFKDAKKDLLFFAYPGE